MESRSNKTALVLSITRVLPSLEHFVTHQLGSESKRFIEAADVVQEVLVRALKSVQDLRFQSDSSTLAWLRLAARRTVVDLARSSARARTKPLDAAAAESSPSAPPLQQALLADEYSQVVRHLRNLSYTDRTLIRSRYLDEKSIAELATLNRCSVATLRVRLHRALDRLRLAVPTHPHD